MFGGVNIAMELDSLWSFWKEKKIEDRSQKQYIFMYAIYLAAPRVSVFCVDYIWLLLPFSCLYLPFHMFVNRISNLWKMVINVTHIDTIKFYVIHLPDWMIVSVEFLLKMKSSEKVRWYFNILSYGGTTVLTWVFKMQNLYAISSETTAIIIGFQV